MRRVALAVLALALAAPAAAQSPVYREDTPHASGHYGSLFFCVRQDTAAALAANGDYIPCIVDATGHVWTAAVQSGAWSVAANAGTNLNTSALVLEATVGRAQGSATAGQTGPLVQGAVTTGTPTYTTAQTSPFSLTTSGGLRVDGSAVTQPVSGPLTDAQLRATAVPVSGTVAATQSGTWTVQPGNTANTTPWLASIHDGTTKASVADLTNANPLHTAIVDASGNQITSFGGGTQYTEADIDTTITGTVVMWEDTSDTLRAASAAKPLPVNVVAGGAGDGKILDGTAAGQADVMSSAPAGTEEGLVTRNIPSGTQPVSGTVTVGTFPDNEPVNVNQLGGTALAVPFDADTGAGTQNLQGVSLRKAASGGSVEAGTSTDPLRVDPTGATTQPISAASLPLPTGASTLGEQQTQTTSLQKIDNIAHAGSDVALSEHVPISGQLDDTATTTVTENQIAPARITSARALHVAQQGTVTVSGTVTANAGSGTFVVGDGAGALNVIVDSSALPSGASTSANQSTEITSLQLIDDLPVAQASTTAGQSGTLVQGAVTASAPTYTTAQTNPFSLQLDGDLRVEIEDALPAGTNNIGDVDVLTLPSVTIGTFPDNEPINVAQMNGVAVTMGNGVAGTGVQRVTLASDSTGQVAIASLPNEGQQTAANSISVTPDTDNDAIAADAAAPPTGRVAIGGLTSGATGGLMKSLTVCDSYANINVVTATTTLLVTGVSGRHVRICSLSLITAGANNVALISGTGATCGTGTTGMTGNTTAATGYNFAANGGIAQGTGLGEINRTNATGDSVCVVTSAAVQLSGRLGYAIY